MTTKLASSGPPNSLANATISLACCGSSIATRIVEIIDPAKGVLWSGSGDVQVSGSTADVVLTSLHGSIDTTRLRSDSARASSEHGSIGLRFATAPMQVQASTAHGDVTMVLPRTGEAYHVDLSTDHGSTDTAVRTDSTARRTVDLSSQHGDVTVRYAPR